LGECYDEKNLNTSTNQALADGIQETNACSCEQHLENDPAENKSLIYDFPPQEVDFCKYLNIGMSMALF
jgi:hypothetical protein